MADTILLVGSGGREHALVEAIARSPRCRRLVVAPGNPGIAAMAKGSTGEPATAGGAGADRPRAPIEIADVAATDTAGLLALATRVKADLVVCGPEGPLAAGLGDAFAAAGVPFFGPTGAAAEIESSKAFAKMVMQKAGVPTAAFGAFTDLAEALSFIEAQAGKVVVKADGLCAGKGVVVTSSKDEARAAVRDMLGAGKFGQAGARVLIEERLFGPEVSMMAFCDGERFAMLASAEDHKPAFDGDLGPNTGGMGAYSPSPLVDEALAKRIAETIFAPTVAQMRLLGRPFRGLLYGGLMLTSRGPMVIEWNGRFGDPETQAVLPRLDEDIVPWLAGAAKGHLPEGAPRFSSDPAVCVVLAAEGYPESPRAGDPIFGLDAEGGVAAPGVRVYHAGTRRSEDRFVTAGGRVLGIASRGSDLAEARQRAHAAIETISWPGMFHRKDIGLRRRP